jgi:hypothetical protein
MDMLILRLSTNCSLTAKPYNPDDNSESTYLVLDPQDEDRIDTCLQMAESVFARYESSGDAHFLEEAILLERRALSLYPKRHPDRAMCCGTLAISLYTLYSRDGDASILSEVVNLQREALTLCTKGNLDRPLWCASLATSLTTQYDRTGDHRLLNEAIDLQREALSFCPLGHTDRIPWCRNLATSLRLTYERTGDQDLLAEAIELQREAVSLCPMYHSDRPSCCGNLANSLTTRYQRTGDDDLLTEAINLLRESLSLCPRGHSRRALWCGNLATAITIRYERCGDDGLLAKAIELEREALSLCPMGHPNHALCCGNLASSLSLCYERTGNSQLLAEAISLEREALSLCPDGHPDRESWYGNLASSLKILYKKTRDVRLLDEAIQLLHQALSVSSPGHMWEYGCQLSWSHLQRYTSHHSVETAIHFLSKSLATEPDSPSQAVNSVLEVLDEFWCSRSGDFSRHHIALVAVYLRTVNLIPLLINPALGIRPQLQTLLKCGQAGPDAFVNAVLAGCPGVGLETLEVVQGIFWSQRVYRRDPQLQDVPTKLARELEDLLRALSIQPLSRSNNESQIRTSLTTQDVRHNQSTRLYIIIQEIRMLPGLDRFMLGESYESLRKVAAGSPVVVLVGARDQFYSLIMSPESHEQDSRCLPLNLSPDDLERACNWHSTQRSTRGSTLKETESSEIDRGMRVKQSSSATPLNRLLRYLWTEIVKPILHNLGLHVSIVHNMGLYSIIPSSSHHHSRSRALHDPDCTGVPPVDSAHFPYMQPEYTTDRPWTGNVAPTMSSLAIHQL